MNPIKSKAKITRAALTLSMLFGVGATTGLTAQAQPQNDRDYRYQRDRDDDQRDRDRDRDRDQNGNRDRDRDHDRDYERNRRGRRWDRYGSYGGSFQLRQTALNAGYNEGIKQGRKDRNHRRHSFSDFSAYRNADHDYSSRLGDKDLYRRYYREGFENGYEDGLRGY